MTIEERREDWRHKVELIIENPKNLSDWEHEFVDSIEDWLSTGRDLNLKQSSKLREVFNRVIS